MYCHLGTIPRKSDNLNDHLSIMWWDPTLDDFKFSGGGLVDGLDQLSGSKLRSLWKMLSSIEDRIKDHKHAFLNPVTCHFYLFLFPLFDLLFDFKIFSLLPSSVFLSSVFIPYPMIFQKHFVFCLPIFHFLFVL